MNRRTALKTLGGLLAAAGVSGSVAWAEPIADHVVGTRALDRHGRVFRYVRAEQSADAGTVVAGAWDRARPVSNDNFDVLGVAVQPIRAGHYGWVQTYGLCILKEGAVENGLVFCKSHCDEQHLM